MARRARAAALLAALVAFAWPTAAGAHSGLVTTDPPLGAALGAGPDEVRLTFSERPEPSLSEVTITDETGASVGSGPAEPAAGDPDTLVVRLPELGRGVYSVDYRVLSAVDGHETEGSYSFGVRASPAQAGAEPVTSEPFFLEVSGAGGGGGDPEPVPNVAPELTDLRIKPKEFQASGKETPEDRKKKKKGAKILVTLSEDATVNFKVKHDPAKRKGKKLPTQKWSRELQAGEQSVRYTGTVDGKTFGKGDYDLLAQAVDGGALKSARPKVNFSIKGG